MPIYEYICQECQNPFERIVLSKSESIACPKCGSERHTQRFSVVNTVTKSSSSSPCAVAEGGECGPAGCPYGPTACDGG